MKFCIVGSGRCGTGFLRGAFDSHPDVFAHTETHWVPKMYEYAGLTEVPKQALFHIFLQTTHTNGEPVVPLSIETLETLFRAHDLISVRTFADTVGFHMAEQKGKSIWADKTPDYGFFMQQIQAVWPDCKFIHLIRNGISVANSMSKHPGFQWIVTSGEATWCSAAFNQYYTTINATEQPISLYADRWTHAITRIRDEATRIPSENYHEVRYETILSAPRESLAELAYFTGITPSSKWLNNLAGRVKTDKRDILDPLEAAQNMSERARNMMYALGYAL